MNSRVPRKACLLPVLIAALCANDALARKWTDSTGRFSVEADFVELVDGQVALKKADGQSIRLPVERLSEADQQHVRSLTAAVTGAQTPSSGRSQPAASSETTPAHDAGPSSGNDGTRTVVAEGVGLTPEEALKDAFRSAVRQVVGEVVDAETLVKDDQLVKDQVLTYSDAYIPRHTKISERSEGGLFRITIRAVVERRKLVVKLKAANVALKGVDGQSVFGSIVSQLENEKDAAALLRNSLEGFPQNCITADVVGEPKILRKDDQKATLRFEIQVRPDLKAYKNFATRLQRTLQSIAKDYGQFTIPFQRQSEREMPQFEWFGVQNPNAERFAAWMPKSVDLTANPVHFRADLLNVALATQSTMTRDRLEGQHFLLDRSLISPLIDTASRIGAGELALLDASGEAIVTDQFPLFEPHPDKRMSGYEGSLIAPFSHYGGRVLEFDRGDASFFLVTSVFEGGNFGESRMEFLHHKLSLSIVRDITLTLEEIKAIDKVRCEIHFD
jgi:hypothetical protein